MVATVCLGCTFAFTFEAARGQNLGSGEWRLQGAHFGLLLTCCWRIFVEKIMATLTGGHLSGLHGAMATTHAQ